MECFEDKSYQKISSLTFNSHYAYFVKNNGECYITTGNETQIDFQINNTLNEYEKFSLRSATKISNVLNKKYITKVTCTEQAAFFITHSGMVFSFGDNKSGELGVGNEIKNTNEPIVINSLIDYRVSDIECGGRHVIAIANVRKQMSSKEVIAKGGGMLFVWGDNRYGQCGEGNENNIYIPKVINKDILIPKMIACGMNHSVIVNENKDILLYGDNNYGQCWNGLNDYLKDKDEKVLMIKASAYSTFVLTDKGSVTIIGKICDDKSILKETKINGDVKIWLTDEKCIIVYYNDGKNMIIKENDVVCGNVKKIKKSGSIGILPKKDELKKKVNPISEKRYGSEKEGDKSLIINSNTNQQLPSSNEIMNKSSSCKNIISPPIKTRNVNSNTSINNSVITKSEKSNRTILQDQTNPSINSALEQSMEELRSYINFVSPIESSSTSASTISFRPKNLPKKTPAEEEYHRSLVEQNRKLYLSHLKEKQLKEQRIKQRIKEKKEKMTKLTNIWNNELLPHWNDLKDKKAIKKYFYYGLPDVLRGKIWLLCLGNTFSITMDYYNIEVKNAIDIFLKDTTQNSSKEKSIHLIDLDIERTFPYLGIFKTQSPLADDLREILRAFVASRPDIGYVQGLSFIAGMSSINMERFKSHIALMKLVLNPMILPFFTMDNQSIKNRITLFKQVFYYNLPELCDHFESLGILPEYYFLEWNMTLFTKSVNIDVAMRIWDVYMIEGITAIYSAGIVFLSHFEAKFMEMNFEDILKQIKSINVINFDDDMLVDAMKNVKYPDWVTVEIERMNEESIPL